MDRWFKTPGLWIKTLLGGKLRNNRELFPSGEKRAQGESGLTRPLQPGGTRAPRAFWAVDSPLGFVLACSILSQLQAQKLKASGWVGWRGIHSGRKQV